MTSNYYTIEKAIKFIEDNFKYKPSLDEIAEHVGLSAFHFQRIFKEWAGITPKQFQQVLTIEHVKDVLEKSKNVFDASIDSDLSSSSRLYDLFSSIEAISPKEFKTKGKGLEIFYGFHESIFGKCLIALTNRGICALRFLDNSDTQDISSLQELEKEWTNAKFIRNEEKTKEYFNVIFSDKKNSKPLKILLKGTNFQVQVWRALLQIPKGKLVTYEDIAKFINHPKALRAVGTAVGHNPISFLVPCHRVINKIGVIGNYRWGRRRKKAMLVFENGR